MYNVNEFCKNKKCEYFREIALPVGNCNVCGIGTSKVIFNIIQIAEDCPHMTAIKKAKKLAKQKDLMWKKLQEPEKSLRKINNMPVYIDVF